MNNSICLKLLLVATISSLLFSCKAKVSVKDEIEAKVAEYMLTYYNDNKKIDSLVHLSFLGFGLGKPVNGHPTLIKETTITRDKACEYKTQGYLNIQGTKIPVTIILQTVNDTICDITGVLKRDCFEDIVSTYKAKYGYPTYGKIEDDKSYKKDGFESFHWRFKNQTIELYRQADTRLDLNSRPIREYLAFRDITIYYYDNARRNRYYSLMREQNKYDKETQPIRDSIEAVRLKVKQDSIARIERQRRLKDVHQI